ncbi:hypothetical protein BJX61DRAFT_460507 [Aspergillus egyptiacus]|nr:hypothetical protein BJX61DRAFT_460507 [Aspergillus egyptiacus]
MAPSQPPCGAKHADSIMEGKQLHWRHRGQEKDSPVKDVVARTVRLMTRRIWPALTLRRAWIVRPGFIRKMRRRQQRPIAIDPCRISRGQARHCRYARRPDRSLPVTGPECPQIWSPQDLRSQGRYPTQDDHGLLQQGGLPAWAKQKLEQRLPLHPGPHPSPSTFHFPLQARGLKIAPKSYVRVVIETSKDF